MTEAATHSVDPLRLSMLMAPDEAGVEIWGDSDLSELWEHQLSTAVPGFPGITFRDVLHGPEVQAEALQAVVRFAGPHRDDTRSPYPKPVAEALFQAGRLLLCVNHAVGPSADEKDSEAIRDLLKRPWLDERTRSILTKAAVKAHGDDEHGPKPPPPPSPGVPREGERRPPRLAVIRLSHGRFRQGRSLRPAPR
jgi:hypothetical protein